jgi:hypothetical protein
MLFLRGSVLVDLRVAFQSIVVSVLDLAYKLGLVRLLLGLTWLLMGGYCPHWCSTVFMGPSDCSWYHTKKFLHV